MTLLRGEPFVAVTRGDVVESVHDVAACATDVHGKILFALGTIDVPVYLRSSAKPFIAAAAIREGVAERFHLEPKEIAVMAASHDGEPYHVDAVRSILAKIGIDESSLLCGPHAPYNPDAARALEDAHVPFTAVHNNCSGKHAGILALCKTLGADPATYLEASNPAQRKILALCARASDEDPATWPLGVDGCGIPVYATPLRKAALAFARLATLEGLEPEDASALEMVRRAMIAYPEYVSGTGDLDAEVMHAGAGDIACKSGAEGVFAAAWLSRGAGLAVKVVDGASRARPPASIAILARLGALDPRAAPKLAALERPVVYNRAGRAVGAIRPLP